MVLELTETPKLSKVDILSYRKKLSALTGQKLEKGLETPRNIEYIFIYNRAVAATIGASISHQLGKKVIFIHDGKDLPYDFLMQEGDKILKVDSYVEKNKLSLEDVKNKLNENNINREFSNEELEQIAENSNLLELLSFCRKNNINPETVAIDPWYGLKSEDPKMIKTAQLLGFNFVGPSSEAVSLIGDKVSANKFAQNTDLTPPPNTGELTKDNIDEVLGKFIEEHKGRKVVLKRADGGGGSGQFLIDLKEKGSGEKLIQKAKEWAEKGIKFDANLWIEKSRHVEMQVIIDGDGNIVFGTPRDCTSQRAKQKIIEETAILTDEQLKSLKESIIKFFKQVEENLGHPYKGPATFEMLQDVESGKFYFLEVNTRKQVELLVTEHQTDKDFITSAIKIAQGYTLEQNNNIDKYKGKHVIEARITLESILSPETIKFIKEKMGEDKVAKPEGGEVKIYFEQEEGVYLYFDNRVLSENKQVADYDSMVGQLVVEGKNRKDAIQKLKKALKKLEIYGIPSNKDLCLAILNSKEFQENTHNSRSPVIKNYIEKQHKKLAKKQKIQNIKTQLIEVFNRLIKSLYPNSKNNELTFHPKKTIFLKTDILLEDILKGDLPDGVFIEYNGNGYNIYFESEKSINKFKNYLTENGIEENNYKGLFNKL